MAQDDPGTLVSTDWLAQHLKDPDLRILDASWHMPDAGRDARAEYEAGHIPGARDQRRPFGPAAHGAAGREIHEPDAQPGRR